MTPNRCSARLAHSLASLLLASSVTASCSGQQSPRPQSSSHAAAPHHSQAVSFTPAQSHRIEDPVYGMPYANVTIPAGWSFNGGVIHAQTCAITGPGPAYAMQSPNGDYGIIMAPELTSIATNDPSVAAQMRQQGCRQNPSSSAADFAQTVFLPHLGLENLKIESVGPAPELEPGVAQLRQQNQQLDAMFPNTRMLQHSSSIDSADVHVSFQAHGRPMEGVVAVLLACRNNRQAFPGLPITQQHLCTAEALGFVFSPVGQSDFALKNAVFKVDLNPAWTEHKQQVFNAQMAAQQQQNQNFTNTMAQQHSNQMAAQQRSYDQHNAQAAAQRQSYDQANAAERNRSNAVHESNQAFAAHIGDYNDYTNTATGQTVRASNQYNNTYMNSTGTLALQTNQADSPGVDWSMMVPRF